MRGKVTLVGAGPGGAGLTTARGLRALADAEVVVYDRLVDEEILDRIPPDAERVDVGKRADCHPVPQAEINRLLLEKARAGKRVVRLKGGDCFLFGRGGEELELLAENGVEFEVVPGVTSALAAPALAGIPATHRDHCASVHIVAGHRRENGALQLDYDALRRVNGTLIFLMSVATFGEIAEGLTRAGFAPDFPCAIVENGARPEQRRLATTLGGAADCIAREGVRAPAVFVVGRVCALAERFDWFDRLPLHGRRALVASGEGAAELANLLRDRGARARELPEPKVEWLPFDLPQPGESLLLESRTAVRALFARLDALGLDARALAGRRLICRPEAARALRAHGLRADVVAAEWPEPESRQVWLLEARAAQQSNPSLGATAVASCPGASSAGRQEGAAGSAHASSDERQNNPAFDAVGSASCPGASARASSDGRQGGAESSASYPGVSADDSSDGRQGSAAVSARASSDERHDNPALDAVGSASCPSTLAGDSSNERQNPPAFAGRLRTVCAAWREAEIDLPRLEADFLAFPSLDGLRSFARATEGLRLPPLPAVCLDEAVARGARALGLRAVFPERPNVEAMAALCTTLPRGESLD